MSNQVDKIDRYNWATPGDRGRYQKIGVGDLLVDHSYQRAEVSLLNTRGIAASFDWSAFGALVIMRRQSGKYYIVDGQQRWLAAKLRGDIRDVPCIVFHSDGREHEAQAFVALNVHRVTVKAVPKFLASAEAGLEPEATISTWLASLDLRVGQDGGNSKVIVFPAHLILTWKSNEQAAKNAIVIQRDINGDSPLHSVCHNGIWWLLSKGVDVVPHINKLMQAGGRSAMLHSVRTLCIETGKAAGRRMCGIGILRLINHRRKSGRIAIPNLDE